jgi:hypothetical protein
MTRVLGFARFWWDFVIGDDWRLALGGAVALGTTALLAQTGVSAWWSTPAIVTAVLVATIARAQPRRPRRPPDASR